jgi:5-methyltetrahydropteroyltriglutamate--homocysteine methyltransferase
MFNATKDRILPTTITGSLPRPAWYTENLAGRPFSTAMGTLSYREQYADALAAFVNEQ